MDKIKKLTYRKPELVDFKWINAIGLCDTGSGDDDNCHNNGNATGGSCTSNGNTAALLCFNNGNAVVD